MKNINDRCGRRAAILFCLTSVLLFSQICHGAESFPVYPEIKPNIEFWKKVYSHYSTDQAIIHDSTDLDIIYEIIELKRPESEENDIINQKKVDAAKRHYRRLLIHLAKHPNTTSPEAKRISALFGPDTDRRRYARAARDVRCQIGQKDRFREGVIRSGAYIETIREIFAAYDLPEALSLLPHVESSFDIHAQSKAGALGIWQFTRSTGRRFLTIGSIVDERRNFVRSTHAAAALLKENYEKLSNWPMAVTAYNHGVYGMMRAKRKKHTYEEIFTSYRSRTFGFASRNFYAEFLAARQIAENHEKYFGELVLDKPRKLHSWQTPGYVAASDLADHLGIALASLRAMNPSLTDSVFDGQKRIPRHHRLHLPVRPGLRLPGFTASLPSYIFMDEQKPSAVYIVEKGDTAGRIARAHGVKLSDLIMANNLDRHATIYVNQKLKLPYGKSGNKMSSSDYRQSTAADSANDLPDTLLSVAAPPPETPGRDNTAKQAQPHDADHLPGIEIHATETVAGLRVGKIRVLPDETLGHYAGWLGTDIDHIRTLNAFHHTAMIRLHQEVKIPLNKISVKTFERRRATYHRKIREVFFNTYRVEETVHYYVKPGDNVWRLSNEVFGVPLWLLGKYNPHVDLTALKRSQKLLIPKVERIS